MMTAQKSPSPKTVAEVPDQQPTRGEDIHKLVYEQRCKDIWILLVVLRFTNALCVRTFFQPDEYFQSLEPAWQMAFGPESGAWLTWVCTCPKTSI